MDNFVIEPNDVVKVVVANPNPVAVTVAGATPVSVVMIRGPQGTAGAVSTVPGLPGIKGDNGTAATVSVGTVSTGNPGSAATVTNSGTSSAAVLNFSIPVGATGATGSAGATGGVGAKGDKGDTGDAATISVGTVTTGNAGTSATVTNAGTSNAAILNFAIPRGGGADIAAETAAATSKTSPADGDLFPLADSEAANALKKWSWANLKAAFKGYYDSVSATLTNKDLTSGNVFPTFNQNTTGNAATATALQTARTINGVSFNGTANITVADATKEPAITAGTTAQYYRGDKSFQTLNATAVGLGNVDNTSDATKNAATATLTNKTISASGVLVKDSANANLLGFGSVASGDSYIEIANNISGTAPRVSAVGTATNVPLSLGSKGTGNIFFRANNGPNSFVVISAASSGSVNYVQVNQVAAGSTPSIGVTGSSDTNTSLNIVSKGSGTVQANGNPVVTSVAVPATATSTGTAGQIAYDSAGYVYICTAANTWRRAAISAW
jgi:hypothetical protein